MSTKIVATIGHTSVFYVKIIYFINKVFSFSFSLSFADNKHFWEHFLGTKSHY